MEIDRLGLLCVVWYCCMFHKCGPEHALLARLTAVLGNILWLSEYYDCNVYISRFQWARSESNFFSHFLSLSIALFVSYILGLRNEYYDALRTWLKPLMTQTARWEPCYRAVKDGFGAHTFHEKCPNHAVTVTLVKVGKYIFGGFADQRWGGM